MRTMSLTVLHQAWRQNRMDMAEQTFSHCKGMTSALTPDTVETLADLLYEIGKDFLGKRQYESAVKWLERAYDVVGEEDLDRLGPEAGELRLSIAQTTGTHLYPIRCFYANSGQLRHI